jgi:hypothetical protein
LPTRATHGIVRTSSCRRSATARPLSAVVTARPPHASNERGQVRVEPHELAALAGVLTLVLRNLSERAAREGTLAEAVA